MAKVTIEKLDRDVKYLRSTQSTIVTNQEDFDERLTNIETISGVGSVTEVSAGDITGLLTSSVATPNSTPDISFSLSTQVANTLFAGPTSGADSTPTFRALTEDDVPFLEHVNFVNVLDYGADPTGVADSTSAFNDAINNGTFYKVYVPEGTYMISSVYLKVADGTNHKGIELIDNSELFGDGIGKTIIKLIDYPSANTTDYYFYPIINGHGVSNAIVHDLEINGNKANQGNYIDDPYTNPAGYYSNPANRWSTPAIMFKDGDNNEVYNVYAHDSQLTGVYAYNTTNMFTHHCYTLNNGGSGVVYHINSTGHIDYVIAAYNKSDQIRIDDCPLGAIVTNCEMAWAGTSSPSPNWFAGIYTGGATSKVNIDNCYIHDNSAYGVDTGSATGINVTNNIIEYNANAGIVTIGGMNVIGNTFRGNGKRTDNVTDTHSNYNPAAICVNSATEMLIVGNRSYNPNSAQTYFIKSWGGGGSTGFNKTTVADNYISGVADVAHLYDGQGSITNITNNIGYTTGGSAISGNGSLMSNAYLQADKYWTINASVATGDSTMMRIGANNSNDGVCHVYNASNNKLLQFGGLALSCLGTYNLQGWSTVIAQGTGISTGNSLTWKMTSSTGDAFFTGAVAVGTSTADSKSILTLSSTTKGFLPPKMTTTQRDAISSPTEALTIYNTTDHKLQTYDGTTWQNAW